MNRPLASSRATARPGPAERGFTLVEVLIGAALSAAVMAAVLSSYVYLGRGLGRLTNQQTLETEGRRTIALFARDARMASDLVTVSSSPTSPASNRVDLTVPTATGTNTMQMHSVDTNAGTAISCAPSMMARMNGFRCAMLR